MTPDENSSILPGKQQMRSASNGYCREKGLNITWSNNPKKDSFNVNKYNPSNTFRAYDNYSCPNKRRCGGDYRKLQKPFKNTKIKQMDFKSNTTEF